jgi:hypothetical protein
MTGWQDPGDPYPDTPPSDREGDEPSPLERPPFDEDPEAQRAPGGGQEDPDTQQPPPMQARAATDNVFDAPGIAHEAVGNDNIREGRVGGVMGPPHAQNGQGQGG